MAEDYRSVRSFPTFKNFTATTTWTEIKLPSNCKNVQIGAQSQALYLSSVGTDGGAVGTDKGFVPAGNYLTFRIGVGATRNSTLYIASQAGSPSVSVLLEE